MQRFSRDFPCPVCGGHDGLPRHEGVRCAGFISTDGRYVHCQRAEKAGGLPPIATSGTYAHLASGPCRCGAIHAPAESWRAGGASHIAATYDYRDAAGTLLFQVVRRANPKTFRQRRPDGKGGWIWHLNGTERVLYRLPELLAARDLAVWVVEGERDADRLASLGLVATCNPMGAGKWRAEHTQALAGRHAIVIADCDAAGREHAGHVADALAAAGAPGVQVLDLAPSRTDGYDVSAWLDDGHTRAQLEALALGLPFRAAQGGDDGADDGRGDSGHAADGAAAARDEATHHLTELGNARRLVDAYGPQIRHVHAWGWVAWLGTHWRRDDLGIVERHAKAAIDGLYDDARCLRKAGKDDQAKSTWAWAFKSEGAARVAATLKLAQTEAAVVASPEDFDTDPWLFNCANGTLDLRTGALRPHDPADLITQMAGTHYDADAACPAWLKFLEQVLPDPEVRVFMHRALGYCLTGSTREQLLFLFYGTGSNGKSTLVSTVHAVLGAYAAHTPSETLLAKREGAPSNDIAALAGRRLVSTAEVEDGRKLAESLVKQLTGGDLISVRFLNKEFFSFHPTFKLFMSTNHKPVIRGQDHGIWRRLRLVPFTTVIDDKDKDPDLPETLVEEAPGILAWMVRGCIDYQAYGLTLPKAVLDATAEYRTEMDTLAAFIEECCVLDPKAETGRKHLHMAYVRWCESCKEKPVTRTYFARRVGERGIGTRTSDGKRFWQGIRVKIPVVQDGGDDADGQAF